VTSLYDNAVWTVTRATKLADETVFITAKKVGTKDFHDSTKEYPIDTKFSPRSKTHEYVGGVQSRRGKLKLVLKEIKEYQPLKHDTLSGYGEKRKKYIR
jgi:hypothetical protein